MKATQTSTSVPATCPHNAPSSSAEDRVCRVVGDFQAGVLHHYHPRRLRLDRGCIVPNAQLQPQTMRADGNGAVHHGRHVVGLAKDVDHANVAVLRVMHAPNASWMGVALVAQADFDNIEALPEPAVGLTILAGSSLLRSLGSCKRR